MRRFRTRSISPILFSVGAVVFVGVGLLVGQAVLNGMDRSTAQDPLEPYTRYVNAGNCDEAEWRGVTWKADRPYRSGRWGHVGSDFNSRAPDLADISDEFGVLYEGDAQYLHKCRAFGTEFGYRFDVPNGEYRVELRFAEPLRASGERWFDVAIQEQVVLDDFDIAAAAGGTGIAVGREFTVVVAGGQLQIDFFGWQGSSDENAIIQAIAVLGQSLPEPTSEPPTATPETTAVSEPTGIVPTDTDDPPTETPVVPPPATEVPPTATSAEPTPTAVPPQLPAYAQYVNVGDCGPAAWQGSTWEADQAYSPGSWGYLGSDYYLRPDYSSGLIADEFGVQYEEDAQYLHRCRTFGEDFSYRFDLPNGNYTVHLRFAEAFNDADERWFDVALEGQIVLDNFDICRAAGGRWRAVERAFVVPIVDGQLQIDFIGGQEGASDRNAIVQAISVVSEESAASSTQTPLPSTVTPVPTDAAPSGTPTPVPTAQPTATAAPTQPSATYVQYVNVGECGPAQWNDATWAADQPYSSGSWGYVGSDRYPRPDNSDWVTDEFGVMYEGDAQYLHRCRAFGDDFGYRFDLPNGDYIVRLRFADAFREPGERWFDVAIEGQTVLDNFDVALEAGGLGIAVERGFMVAVADGQLQIDFVGGQDGPIDDNAMVQAIAVVSAEPGSMSEPTPQPTLDPTALAGMVTVHPAPLGDVYLANPGIGWQDAHSLNDPRFPETTPYRRWNWRQFHIAPGVYDWSLIESLCQPGQQCHIAIVMSSRPYHPLNGRMMPDWVLEAGATEKLQTWDGIVAADPDYANCTWQQYHDEFVEALREEYDGDPRIWAVDMRSHGRYGEAHTTPPPSSQDEWLVEMALERIYAVWLGGSGTATCRDADGTLHEVAYNYEGWQETPLLYTFAWYVPELRDLFLDRYADKSNLGVRHDCLGSVAHHTNIENNLDAFTAHWRTAPVAFEACSYAYQPDELAEARSLASLTHGSVLHDNYGGGGDDALIANVMRSMGYRYVLRELTHPASAAPGESIEISMRWENVGYAPAYTAYPLVIYLTDSVGNVVAQWQSNIDVRTWLPDEEVAFAETLVIPGSLSAGTYDVRVALMDSYAQTPLNLANEGRDRQGHYLASALTLTPAGAAVGQILAGLLGTATIGGGLTWLAIRLVKRPRMRR